MKRNKTFFIDSLKSYNFLDTKYVYVEGRDYEVPFSISPTKGRHNLSVCESCRLTRENLIKELQVSFDEFPNCCELHKKLAQLLIFDKNDFAGTPVMIADKIMFSYHHVINHLDNDDWYEDIADYFEYAYESFGSMPTNFGEPFKRSSYIESLKQLLKNIEGEITSDKITDVEVKLRMNKVLLLLEPIEDKEEKPERDFNLLLSKYDEWYKIFPFDLPYFSHLKEKFQRTLPLYTGRKRHNKYLNTTLREIHTKDSFAIVLLRITKDILTSINGLSLYEQNLISDTEKHQIDLIINNRKLELYELSSLPNTNKKQYIKILKKWFEEEKRFIKEISPLIKDIPTVETNLKLNRTDLAYYIYYMNETKSLKLKNSFPSDSAWKEIGELFHKNWKNIQQVYNIISYSRDERLKSSRIKNIEIVINELLQSHEKALNLANDELNMAKLNS